MTPTVFIVDDDTSVREALETMLDAMKIPTKSFPDGETFLAACKPEWRGCILLDLAMPRMSGLEVQKALSTRGVCLPVIYLTAHGEVTSAVRAMKGGAIEFMEKPAAGAKLIEAVRRGLAADSVSNDQDVSTKAVRARAIRLTAREREILALAVRGKSNKDIGRQLGISYRTVEIHRSRGMRKLDITTPFELAAVASVCGLADQTLPASAQAVRG